VTAHPVTSRNGRAPETARRSRPAGFAGIARGTLVGFAAWLDQIQQAAPSTVNRRITGVTARARARAARVPKEATQAARAALKGAPARCRPHVPQVNYRGLRP
jgi:hypothetical protein